MPTTKKNLIKSKPLKNRSLHKRLKKKDDKSKSQNKPVKFNKPENLRQRCWKRFLKCAILLIRIISAGTKNVSMRIAKKNLVKQKHFGNLNKKPSRRKFLYNRRKLRFNKTRIIIRISQATLYLQEIQRFNLSKANLSERILT